MVKEANLFINIYNYYEKHVIPENKIDFSDMIYYANKYMSGISENQNILDYKYLIIDEYQDISEERYEFARNISLLSNCKVTSVGDDWQTIFSFAGSRIDLFLNYSTLFPGAKQLFINSTYRNSQELINIAGNFIMENPFQIKKNLISSKRNNNPIKICYYDFDEYDMVKNIIGSIYQKKPDANILILSRKKKHIDKLCENYHFKKGIGTRIICEEYPHAIINLMTVHSAKGLGADEVILLNVTNKDFPCPEKENIWLKNILKNRAYQERYPYAEDRRIFYVALTRTKNNVYILTPIKKENQSPFVKELIKS